MMAILGSRGLLEWLLIAEDECVEKLMIASRMLAEKALADHLTRLCSDKHLHVVQTKREVLGMVGLGMGESGGISELIFWRKRWAGFYFGTGRWRLRCSHG